MSTDVDTSKSALQQETDPTILEWIFRVISVIIVVSLCAFFSYQALNDNTQVSFKINIQTDESEQVNGNYHMVVNVTNTGKRSAEFVIVECKYKDYTATQTIKILGAKEAVTLVFVLPENPTGNSEVNVLSYINS